MLTLSATPSLGVSSVEVLKRTADRTRLAVRASRLVGTPAAIYRRWEPFETRQTSNESRGLGMIFKTFDGKLLFVLHQPNNMPASRAYLFEVLDEGDKISLRPYNQN